MSPADSGSDAPQAPGIRSMEEILRDHPTDPESQWVVKAWAYDGEPVVALALVNRGQEVAILLLAHEVDDVIGALQRARDKADCRKSYEAPACEHEGKRE